MEHIASDRTNDRNKADGNSSNDAARTSNDASDASEYLKSTPPANGKRIPPPPGKASTTIAALTSATVQAEESLTSPQVNTTYNRCRGVDASHFLSCANVCSNDQFMYLSLVGVVGIDAANRMASDFGLKFEPVKDQESENAKVKSKSSAEFEKFDRTMDGLLAVPYSELQKKLEAEKQDKEKRKKKRVTASSSRVSAARKKRVG